MARRYVNLCRIAPVPRRAVTIVWVGLLRFHWERGRPRPHPVIEDAQRGTQGLINLPLRFSLTIGAKMRRTPADAHSLNVSPTNLARLAGSSVYGSRVLVIAVDALTISVVPQACSTQSDSTIENTTNLRNQTLRLRSGHPFRRQLRMDTRVEKRFIGIYITDAGE